MKCPYCNTRLGGNPYGEGRLCSRCGYVEALDDKKPVVESVEVSDGIGVKVAGDGPVSPRGDQASDTEVEKPVVRHTPKKQKKGKKQ